MTKDLSKKLCEIVGIKPRYGIYVNFGDLDKNYRLVTDERRCKLISDYRYQVDNEDDLRGLRAVYYPDFGKPENFVKLLNVVLKIGINEVCDFQRATMSFSQENYAIEGETFEDIWLNCLLCELESHNPYSWERKYSEMLKQAIREAGWKYE